MLPQAATCVSLCLKSVQSERLLSSTLAFFAACSEASTASRPALFLACFSASASALDTVICAPTQPMLILAVLPTSSAWGAGGPPAWHACHQADSSMPLR